MHLYLMLEDASRDRLCAAFISKSGWFFSLCGICWSPQEGWHEGLDFTLDQSENAQDLGKMITKLVKKEGFDSSKYQTSWCSIGGSAASKKISDQLIIIKSGCVRSILLYRTKNIAGLSKAKRPSCGKLFCIVRCGKILTIAHGGKRTHRRQVGILMLKTGSALKINVFCVSQNPSKNLWSH